MRILIFLRSLFVGIFFLLMTLVGCIVTYAVAPLPNHFFLQSWILYTWGKWTLRLYGLEVVVLNRPEKEVRGSLYLFNHSSNIDIPVLTATLKSDFRFGAKIELFSVPFFGLAMKFVGVLPIARDNRAEVFRVYEAAKKRVEKGENFILAPEGTRQEVDHIGPFKGGPFVFAINAQMPLVPVVIYGARRALPRGAWQVNAQAWHSKIYVEVCETIPVAGYTLDRMPELQQKAREAMLASYERLKNLAAEQDFVRIKA
jgi:1-acyl-sn-glycerol-3-phosphate acyltransferase